MAWKPNPDWTWNELEESASALIDRLTAERNRAWDTIIEVEKILEEHDIAITSPLSDAILDLIVGENDPGGNRLGPFSRDSITSRKAALDNYPRSGTQRERILREIILTGKHGMTREEIELGFGWSGNTVRPRVAELIEGGWLEETDHTRKTLSGNDAATLIATEKSNVYYLRA